MTRAAGADITLAVIRCPAILGMRSFKNPTYAASTPPATVANPPAITAISSDFVIDETYGRITSGASVCPTKIFAEIERVSLPLDFIVLLMSMAKPLMTNCMMPR